MWTASNIAARKSEERTRALELRVAEQQERAAKAEKALLDVQSAIRPRWLNFKEGDEEGKKARAAEVSKFAGTVVAIQAVPDLEAEKLAFQMAAGLRRAGWIVDMLTDKPRVPIGFIQSGVVVATLEQPPVFPTPGDPPGTRIKTQELSRASLAARALVAEWEVTLGPPFGPQFFGIHWEPVYPLDSQVPSYLLRGGFKCPKDGVLVLIGQQPIEYLMPPTPKGK